MSGRASGDRISKTQRWLDLIAFLVGRRFPVTVEEIMEGVPAYAERWHGGGDTDRASVRRTFERDKDELRDFGVPLETVEFSINYGQERTDGYRILREDFYLPYLRLVEEGREAGEADEVLLDEEEARSALDALRRVTELPAFPLLREARSAFRKLAFDLDPERFGPAPVLYLDAPGSDELLHAVRELSDALQRRKRVTFRYYGIHRDRTTERSVRPYGLLFQHGHWYLVAWDEGREDLRIFRVGRMEDPEVSPAEPATPDYAVPDDFSLERYRDRSAWELGDDDEEPVRARVRFDFPRSLWAARNAVGELVEELEGGGAVRSFRVRQPGPFLRWILGLAGEAEILEPETLQEELREMAQRVVGAHGG